MNPSRTNSPLRVGIIGCGKISQAYFTGAKVFESLKIVACADLNPEVARAKAEANGCEAVSVDDLLGHPEIDLVINLTVPAAHGEIDKRSLEAGKHVYSEKPFTVELEEGREVLALAEARGLRVGCAPDTFLGAGLQTCRKLVDEGAVGRVVAGTAFMLSRGPESWHPNPGFYYLKGGGPVLDMGPYYLTALVNLIGPVKRVAGITSRALDVRVATCEERRGEELPVEVSTHASASLEFHSGAVVTAVFSFDVPRHGHAPIELYGTDGSLRVPDPNTFGGPVACYRIAAHKDGWTDEPLSHRYAENTRGIGAADMACAINSGREHRANGLLALHVLEVMHAIEESSRTGTHVDIESRPARPAPLPVGLVAGTLDP
ncbi:MAG: Gfo/Idh/MocA family protein [Puniceicoccaceae bacterium]